MMQPQILLCRPACFSVIVIGKMKKKVANDIFCDVEHKLHAGSFPGKMSRDFTVHALTQFRLGL